MATNFRDFLCACVQDPGKVKQFFANPNQVSQEFGLTENQKKAVLSQHPALIAQELASECGVPAAEVIAPSMSVNPMISATET